ncbi:MAG TPA: inositol monophosphatase, partial [Candidatus Saccharimonadales bacterium]|nr:inositol monophosphatase [Candidatus Saccharimonadales bacterium]
EKTRDYGTVSEADTAVEQFLKTWVRTTFPDESIVAEESGGEALRIGWTIDPIDGTNFFAHGLTDWSISLSRFVDGEVVLGITYCPPTDEMFWAVKGSGAFVNGIKVKVSDLENPKREIVNLGQDIIRLYNRVDIEEELIKESRTHWAIGSTALALCKLGEGKIDLAVHMKQSIWDIAVGSLFIPEAGGRFRTWDSSPLDFSGKRANDIYADNGSLPQDWPFLS